MLMLLFMVFFLGHIAPVVGAARRPRVVASAMAKHAGMVRSRGDDGACGHGAKRRTSRELIFTDRGDVFRPGDDGSEGDDSDDASTVRGEACQRSPGLDALVAAAGTEMAGFDLAAGVVGGAGEPTVVPRVVPRAESVVAAPPAGMTRSCLGTATAGGASRYTVAVRGEAAAPAAAGGTWVVVYPPPAVIIRVPVTPLYVPSFGGSLEYRFFILNQAIFDVGCWAAINDVVERAVFGLPTDQRVLIFNTLMYCYTVRDSYSMFSGNDGAKRLERLKYMMQALSYNIRGYTL